MLEQLPTRGYSSAEAVREMRCKCCPKRSKPPAEKARVT